MNTATSVATDTSLPAVNNELHVPMQTASIDIWASKYQLKSKSGEVIDETIDDTYRRVAKAIASVEQPDVAAHWEERFLWALRLGAIPAGRTPDRHRPGRPPARLQPQNGHRLGF